MWHRLNSLHGLLRALQDVFTYIAGEATQLLSVIDSPTCPHRRPFLPGLDVLQVDEDILHLVRDTARSTHH